MKYIKTPTFQNRGTIVSGSERLDNGRVVTFEAKVFEQGSDYGLGEGGGKISKLEIRDGITILASYERGWCKEPDEEMREFYERFIHEFN